jgi:hypothetical protein
MSTKFQALKLESKQFQDDNDCSVIALAALTGQSYREAQIVLSGCGRETGKGILIGDMQAALGLYDLETTKVVSHDRHRSFVVVWYSACGKFGHVSAMVHGELVDWKHGMIPTTIYLVSNIED